jgi:hypothetical protein
VPFTFSHPAIVLPIGRLFRNRFSPAAMVIGSMTPDFEYFINFKQHSIYSHTWPGMFWFDLPLALLVYFLFTTIVKDQLIYHLPGFLNVRFSRFINVKRSMTVKKVSIIVTALLIGIVSHLLWDKVTHRTVRLVEEGMELYSFIWDANSLIGAAFIGIVVWQMPKSDRVVSDRRTSFWLFNFEIVLLVMVLNSRWATWRTLGVSAISGLFIALLLSSILLKQPIKTIKEL